MRGKGIITEFYKNTYSVHMVAYSKVIRYKLKVEDLPASLKLDVGDEISFEFSSKSTMKHVIICNVQLNNKAEYKEYLEIMQTKIEALPRAHRYPINKVMGMCLDKSQRIKPDNFVEGFGQMFGLVPTYYSEVYIAGKLQHPAEIILLDK